MKYRLTPELSYFIGFWKKLRCYGGIGIRGDPERIDHFVKLAIDLKLTTPDKLLIAPNHRKAHFFHTKLRTFIQDIMKNELERFKYKNDYAASYLAGIFDAAGSTREARKESAPGKASTNTKEQKESMENVLLITAAIITPSNKFEEHMIARLGYRTRLVKNVLFIPKGNEFMAFIEPYRKLGKGWVLKIEDENNGNEPQEQQK